MAIKDTPPITLSVTVRGGPRSEAWNALWRWLLAPEPLTPASPSIVPTGASPIAARRPRATTPRPKRKGGGADAA
jgi:hypothetical protein